jgi:hypothetical protein
MLNLIFDISAFLLVPWCLGGEFRVARGSENGKAREALANLRKVRSFAYTLNLARSEPPVLGGRFTGSVVLPDTQEQEGAWNDQPGFRMKARGNLEYVQNLSGSTGVPPVPRTLRADSGTDTSWSVLDRDEEADFLTQVDRALALDSFVLTREDAEFMEFSFEPNVPFLDPDQTKRLAGRFKVRRDRLLPDEISIASNDRTVSWQATFSHYDQVKPIVFPFVRAWRIALLKIGTLPFSPRKPVVSLFSKSDTPTDTTILRRRFARHGYETQFLLAGDTLVLFLEREIRDDALGMLVQQGRVEVWLGRLENRDATVFAAKTGGVPIFRPIPESARVLPVLGDSTRRMILERRVLTREDLAGVRLLAATQKSTESSGVQEFRSSTPQLSNSQTPQLLELRLTKSGTQKAAQLAKLEKSGMYWVLVMDSAIAGAEKMLKRKKPELIELQVSQGTLPVFASKTGGVPSPPNSDFTFLLSSVLDLPPLEARFVIKARGRINPND